MPIEVSTPPALPVWDCHICGLEDAFIGHPDAATTVIRPDGTTTGGFYHYDDVLCMWIERPGEPRRPWPESERFARYVDVTDVVRDWSESNPRTP